MSVISPEKTSTRQNILDKAISIFRQKGFQKTRVSDIVAAAGLAQGTFYLYFKSKEDIAREICKNFMDSFSDIFTKNQDVFENVSLDLLEDRICQMLKAALEVFKNKPEAAEIVMREGVGQGGVFKELYEDFIVRFIDILSHRIATGRSREILRVHDPKATSVFIVGLVERSFFLFMIMEKKLDVKRISREMTSFILRGLNAAQ